MWPFTRERRNLPPGALLTHPAGAPTHTWALGAAVDTDRALRLSAVWACVRLLADTVATLPVDVYRGGTVIDTPAVLVEPAAGTPTHEWLYSVMTSLLLRGNAYGLITTRSGPALLPAQVELVHPDLVGVTADPHTGAPTYRIGGRPHGRHEVWHVRAFTQPGVLVGMSPISYAAEAIALGLAAEKFGAQFFGSGATPSGVLSTDTALGPDQAKVLLERWRAAHAGQHDIAVLSGGVKFQPISVAAEESQFVESQRFTVTQVARVFGVSPEMIGGDPGNSLTYSTTAARAADYVRYTVGPWLVRLETALARLLPTGHTVKLNPDALLRGTTAERYAAHEVALRAGFLTINEVRALENRPPLPSATRPDPTGVA